MVVRSIITLYPLFFSSFFVAFAIARLVLYSGICVRTPAVPDVSFAFLLEEPGANLSVEEIPLCWCPAAINTVLCFFAFVFFFFFAVFFAVFVVAFFACVVAAAALADTFNVLVGIIVKTSIKISRKLNVFFIIFFTFYSSL